MKKRILFYVIVNLCFLNSSAANIIFRYDDFGITNSKLDSELISIFIKNKMPIVLGAIPTNQNEEINRGININYIPGMKNAIKNGLVEVALHGLNHVQQVSGEFGGLPYQEQYRRIEKGKSIIEKVYNVKVRTFIPPWNKYDSNTLKVLEKLDFNCISSDFSNIDFESKNLNYFPYSIDTPLKLKNAINQNQNNADAIIVLMFHSYDLKDTAILNKLKTLIINIKNEKRNKFYTFSSINLSYYFSSGNRIKVNQTRSFCFKHFSNNLAIQSICDVYIFKSIDLIIVNSILLIVNFLLFSLFKMQLANIAKYLLTEHLLVSILMWYEFFSFKSLMLILISYKFVLTLYLFKNRKGIIYKNQ